MAAMRGKWGIICGRHPILEAMKAGRVFKEIAVADGVGGPSAQAVIAEAEKRNIPVRRLPRKELDRVAGSVSHQGFIATVRSPGYMSLDDLLPTIPQGQGLLLVADGIEDPHNLGAIIRSANAAGAHGVIIGKHRAVGVTESVAKTSAGAVYHTPVVQVTNIANALEHLKKSGYWTYATVPGQDGLLWDVDLTGNVALVIGGEGRGISRLVLERCDFKVSIPMLGAVSSLNASVAAAIFLYEALRQRWSR